jgi:hypothetical protein
MLNELLVLGQIPGTNFDITFNQLMIVSDVALLIFLLRKWSFSLAKIRAQIYYFRLYLSLKHSRQLSLTL